MINQTPCLKTIAIKAVKKRKEMHNITAQAATIFGLLSDVLKDVNTFTYFSAALFAIIAFVSYSFLISSKFKDAEGNKIPRGPTGFPILGESLRILPKFQWTTD